MQEREGRSQWKTVIPTSLLPKIKFVDIRLELSEEKRTCDCVMRDEVDAKR